MRAGRLEGAPTTLYVLKDARGAVLYVGITAVGPSRFDGHRGDKAWWPDAASAEFTHFPNRRVALAAERLLIRCLRPPYNIEHRAEAAWGGTTAVVEICDEPCTDVLCFVHGPDLALDDLALDDLPDESPIALDDEPVAEEARSR